MNSISAPELAAGFFNMASKKPKEFHETPEIA